MLYAHLLLLVSLNIRLSNGMFKYGNSCGRKGSHLFNENFYNLEKEQILGYRRFHCSQYIVRYTFPAKLRKLQSSTIRRALVEVTSLGKISRLNGARDLAGIRALEKATEETFRISSMYVCS